MRNGLTLSALGGSHTFGGEAAQRMLELYPGFFSNILYHPTAEEAFESVVSGRAAATCAPEQMAKTGVHPGIQDHIVRFGSKNYVACSVTHAYHCSLLGKPGTDPARIRRVLGHTGSITQSRPWLEKHLPQAEIEIVHTNSMGAGQTVLQGDGSIASVGTPNLARQLRLAELAKDIDEGSVANYWAVSREPFFVERPTSVIVAGRFGGDGSLSDVVVGLAEAGFRLRTLYPRASGQALYEYDCVLTFTGSGALSGVEEAVRRAPGARLAGAYEARD